MDLKKIEAIIEAINAEANQPQPSHANLARLVAMAFKELINLELVVANVQTQSAGTTANGATEIIYRD